MSIRWTAPEIETLCSMTGDMPWRLVVPSFQQWAEQNGFPVRPERYMLEIVRSRGIPRLPSGEWITSAAIVQTLGVCHATVTRWRRSGLQARQFGTAWRSHWYIRRDWLREFARERPHLFAGRREADLLQVLDCPKLARKLAMQDRPPCWRRCPVVCVETGRRFPSIRAAAQAAFVTKQRMRNVILSGGTANGLHWRFA